MLIPIELDTRPEQGTNVLRFPTELTPPPRLSLREVARAIVTDWRARRATKAAGQGLKPESGCMGLESGTTLSQMPDLNLETVPPTPTVRVLPSRSVPPDSAVNGRLTVNAAVMRIETSAEERERAEAQVRELGEVRK